MIGWYKIGSGRFCRSMGYERDYLCLHAFFPAILAEFDFIQKPETAQHWRMFVRLRHSDGIIFQRSERSGALFSSLSDLKEIGCKSVWLIHISPLFRPIEWLLAFKIRKICPHPDTFSLRFFKPDRLPAGLINTIKP